MRARRRIFIVALMAVAFVTLAAAPAFAHAVLLGTSPVDGSIYPTVAPPTSVSMHFGEDVGVKLGAVRVYDEHGKLLSTGAPGHPPGDGSTVIASLPKLGAGTYVVTWRVISADTHPVGGAFTFTVGTQKQNVSKLASHLLSSSNGSKVVGVLYGIERFLLFSCLIALIGGSAFVALVWPAGRRSRRATQILWTAWCVALAVTLLGFAIEGIYAAAFPLREILNRTVLSDTLHGRFGETAAARFMLLLVGAPLLRLLVSRKHTDNETEAPLRWWWAPAAVIVGISTIVTVTLASHATTGRWTALATPADVLHVSAVSLWFGGLLMLTAAVVPGATAETLDHVVPRYSNFALGAVIAIVLSGTFQALRQVGTIHALDDTVYGHFLLAKLVAFGVLIIFAMLSREVVNAWYVPRRDKLADAPDLAGPASSTVGAIALAERPPTAIDNERERLAHRQLRMTIRAEVVIAIVVLVLTAFLVDTRPAYEITTGPQIFTAKSSPTEPPVVWFNVVVEPAKGGLNQIHLTTETPEGGVANPFQVTMELTNPKKDIGPLQVPLVRIGPGHYVENAVEIPFAGTWQITVRALMTQIDESDATHNITIR